MKILVLITFVTLALKTEVKAACSTCTSGFSCISTNQYYSCDSNSAVLLNTFETCASGSVCDNSALATGAKTPCIASGTATCSNTALVIPTTTTPKPATNWNAWCSGKTGGRYPNPNDTTCKTYVLCYLSNGMKGAVYTCVGSTLFDKATSYCATGVTC